MDFEKPQMDLNRALSWSSISSFRYSKEQWYAKYVLKQEEPASKAMLFGNVVGERIASDPSYLPQVPRGEIFEYALRSRLKDIPLVGYIDSYSPHHTLHEYKTGMPPWTQKRVDDHQQIDMYLLGLYLIDGVKPKDVSVTLHWLPTQENGDFSISLKDEKVVHSFATQRSFMDIVNFMDTIQKTYEEMQQFARNY